MGPFVADFRARLSGLGYSDLAVRNMLKDVGAVGRWMQEREMQARDLSPALIAEFRNDRMVAGMRKIPSIKSFEPLFGFLRQEGVLAEPPEPDCPAERLLADCRRWLVTERGLAQTTIIRYENLVRRFLALHAIGEGLDAGST
jgi:hypothetical protein